MYSYSIRPRSRARRIRFRLGSNGGIFDKKNDFVGDIKYIGTFECRGDTVKYATYSEILTLYTSDDLDSSPT